MFVVLPKSPQAATAALWAAPGPDHQRWHLLLAHQQTPVACLLHPAAQSHPGHAAAQQQQQHTQLFKPYIGQEVILPWLLESHLKLSGICGMA